MLVVLEKIEKKPVVVVADDFSIRSFLIFFWVFFIKTIFQLGGHSDGAVWLKQPSIEKMARENRIPVIRLLDGSSGGGSVATILTMNFTYVPMLLGNLKNNSF